MAKLNFACTGETVFRHVAHKDIISFSFPCRAISLKSYVFNYKENQQNLKWPDLMLVSSAFPIWSFV